MEEFHVYVCLLLPENTNLEELENHLSMNGYDFGIDKNKNFLFVFADELAYVATILSDRNIFCDIK